MSCVSRGSSTLSTVAETAPKLERGSENKRRGISGKPGGLRSLQPSCILGARLRFSFYLHDLGARKRLFLLLQLVLQPNLIEVMRKQHSITEFKNKFLCLLQVVSNSYFIKAIDRIFYGWVYWRKRPTCGAGVTIKILVNNELYQAFLVVLLRRQKLQTLNPAFCATWHEVDR